MAGLLGEGWDDPRSAAIMALAGGLLRKDFGGGLLGANQAYAQGKAALSDAEDRKLKRGLLEAQIDETKAQAEERKNKVKLSAEQQARQDRLLFGEGMSPGAFTAPTDGVGPTMPQGMALQGGGVMGLAKQLGIPPEAIQADIAFNGGKKISEILNARSAPKWENVNGNLVNTNAQGFQGGFQPGMSTSANGQVTAWQPDGRGGVTVGAPRGALETYSAYRGIDEGQKANFDPVTVTPAGQPPQMTTRGALVRRPEVSGAQVPPAQQAAMDRDRATILQGEMAKAQAQLKAALQAGDQSAAARAQNDIASLTREMGGKAASVGMALQSPEEALRGQKGVEGDAKANEARATDVKTARKFLQVASQVEQILQGGQATASGFGSVMDKGAAFFGKSTPGAVAAQQLTALGGWLTANVPRMEGPQSNFDVGNYQRMAADVGNDTLPIDRRLAALRSIQGMMGSIVDGGAASKPAAPAGGAKIKFLGFEQ